MIHSRKLNIKAIVTFYAVVDELAVVETSGFRRGSGSLCENGESPAYESSCT